MPHCDIIARSIVFLPSPEERLFWSAALLVRGETGCGRSSAAARKHQALFRALFLLDPLEVLPKGDRRLAYHWVLVPFEPRQKPAGGVV